MPLKTQIPTPIQLAQTPTPLEFLERVSVDLGVSVYVKRDDLTGMGLSGNKVRKLEFLFAEALAEGADHVLTCGAIQSNHCRATAVAAARLHLSSTVVLHGEPEATPDGNFLIDELVGAQVVNITLQEYRDRDTIMEREADRLRAEGKQPYIIPEGGSNALGSLGYVTAMEEIQSQSSDRSLRFNTIISATGSSGTHVGLAVGAKCHDFDGDIIGINVCGSRRWFEERADQILEEMETRFVPDLSMTGTDCHFLDGQQGEGYGLYTDDDLRGIRELATQEGMLLDPVYTFKAWKGMLQLIETGDISQGGSVLFLHTGGLFGLFPARDRLKGL